MSLITRAAVLFLLLAGRIAAQPMLREASLGDSSSAVIMAHVNPRTESSWFVNILRQTPRAVAQSKLDELADSLAARAIAKQGFEAGYPSPIVFIVLAGDRGLHKGVAYKGALDRLIRIHKQATDHSVRTQALAAMPGVVGRERGLAYVTSVATSNDSTSWYAIGVLTTDANGGSSYGPNPSPAESTESDAILRGLVKSGVPNPTAQRFLTEWALQKRY